MTTSRRTVLKAAAAVAGLAALPFRRVPVPEPEPGWFTWECAHFQRDKLRGLTERQAREYALVQLLRAQNRLADMVEAKGLTYDHDKVSFSPPYTPFSEAICVFLAHPVPRSPQKHRL